LGDTRRRRHDDLRQLALLRQRHAHLGHARLEAVDRPVRIAAPPHARRIPVLRDLALEPVEEARVDPPLRRQRGLVAVLDVLEVIDRAAAERALEHVLRRLEVGYLWCTASRAVLPLGLLGAIAALLLERRGALARRVTVPRDRARAARRRALRLGV